MRAVKPTLTIGHASDCRIVALAGAKANVFGAIAYDAVFVKLTFYYPEEYWPEEKLDLSLLIPLIFVVVGLGMVLWPRKRPKP